MRGHRQDMVGKTILKLFQIFGKILQLFQISQKILQMFQYPAPGEQTRHTHGALGWHLPRWLTAGARPEKGGRNKISLDGITWLFSLVAAQNRGVARWRASNTFTPTWWLSSSILLMMEMLMVLVIRPVDPENCNYSALTSSGAQ